MSGRINLVGCGKAKAEDAAQARDLYTGGLTRDRINYAMGRSAAYGEPWWILSAEHGLLRPRQVTHPYDRRLANLGELERASWALAVAQALVRELPTGCNLRELVVEIHAGRDYVEPLGGILQEGLGIEVSTPLEGLAVGHQRRWYAEQRGQIARAT